MTVRRSRIIPFALIAAALATVGCGDDDSGETTPSVSIPSVTVPSVSTPTSAEQTSTDTTPDVTTTKGGSYDPSKPDSPENDLPPPAGSPQDAFEQQCEQNPAACG